MYILFIYKNSIFSNIYSIEIDIFSIIHIKYLNIYDIRLFIYCFFLYNAKKISMIHIIVFE